MQYNPILLLLSFLTILTLALIAYVAYLKLCREYTREKYAFAALVATLSIVALGLGAITAAPPWTAVATILAQLLDKPFLAPPPPNWAEKALVLAFCAYALRLLHTAFLRWDGPISVQQFNLSRLHEPTNYLVEGLSETRRIYKREAPSPVYERLDRAGPRSALEPPREQRAWRDEARELFELRWQQYIFDIDQGWHERASCWIGRDIKTDGTVALMCCQEEPAHESLRGFVTYVERLRNTEAGEVEFLLAVRDGPVAKSYSVADRNIRSETEDSLLRDLVDFTDYVMDLRRRVEREPLPDSDLTLTDIYTPSRLTDGEGNELDTTLEDYLSAWLQEPGQRHLAVLGEYGQGKSTGTLMFAHRLLIEEDLSSVRVPLFVELRGKSPSTLQPVELLGAWASAYRIDPRALMKLLVKGRVFIIFEGFDEMAGVADPEARLNHFRALWRFCFPAAKLVFTGRPNFFLDDTELKADLGVGPPLGAGPYCEHVYLRPFDLDQIEDSLRWAEPGLREEILALARQDPKLFDIVSRPSLLYLVARLWRLPEFSKITDTVDAARVMGVFIQHCYRRQTEKHRGFPHFMVLTEAERGFFMDGIASFMAARDLQNQIARHQFDEAISALYAVLPDHLDDHADLPDVPLGPLRERLAEREDALEAIQTDVRTCGLLVRDYSRPNALKFPHKSFFEYLLGAFVANCLLGRRPEYCASIRAASQLRLAAVLDIPESLSFVGEIVSHDLKADTNDRVKADYLFDTIVAPGRFSFVRWSKRLYLYLVLFPEIRVLRWLLPLLMMMVMMVMLGTFIIFPLRDRSFSFNLALLLGMSCPLLLNFWVWYSRWRLSSVVLWYSIARCLGISQGMLAERYGKVAVSAVDRRSKKQLFFLKELS